MFKKIFTTLLIILGIGVGAIAVCVGIMVCFPNVSLFGFNYVKDDNQGTAKTINIDGNDVYINDIVGLSIDLDKYDLEIERNENATDNKIEVKTFSSFVGLLRANENGVLHKTVSVVPYFETVDSGKILHITANEPQGIIIPSKLCVKIRLNISANNGLSNLKNISLNVKNANLKIYDNLTSISAENVTISKGNATKSISIGNLYVKNSLTLNVDNGIVDLKESTTSNTNVIINTRDGTFRFNNVKNLQVNSVANPYIEVAGGVYGDLQYYCKSGNLIVGTAYKYVDVKTDSSGLKFDCLKGVFLSTNYNGDNKCNSSIEIGSIESITGASEQENIANIETIDGNITINKIERNSTITSSNGNITIGGDAYVGVNCSKITIATNGGKINAYFNKNKKVQTNIMSDRGLVNVYDINPESNSLIKSNERAEMYVKIASLSVDDFKIEGRGKQVKVVVPTNKININVSTEMGASVEAEVIYLNSADKFRIDKNNYQNFNYADTTGLSAIEGRVGFDYATDGTTAKMTITSNSNIIIMSADVI